MLKSPYMKFIMKSDMKSDLKPGMKFKPVFSQVDLPRVEEQITNFWKENRVFERSVEQRDPNNLYTFVDGPPFVSGLPHYGHLCVSIAKDLIPRYQTMRGKRVRRVFGWDCHGLPIEEKVNRLLDIHSNKQLEKDFGVEKYVKECRKFVQNCISDWRWYIEKIGRWVDIDNAYYTMNVDFMESVIWTFKQIYEKGLIYKGKRVSLFSTDTSTPVSDFEVAMDPDNYREVEDLSVFVKFKLAERPQFLSKAAGKDVYLVAWTTTPWTIPANFALAVNENFVYVLVQHGEELFIVAKDRVIYAFEKNSNVRIISEFNGKELEGLRYESVFDSFADKSGDNDFKVYFSEEVKLDEGTGVLHIAPAFGEVDFQIGLKHKISSLSDIDEEGKMTIAPWQGVYLRDASSLVAEDMKKKGALLRSELYTHRLPFYRGENPLIYMAQEAYFIDIQSIKEKMLELNEQIHWIPGSIKQGRFAQTIKSSPDWCISRNRYWATIMPIWKSEDGEEIIVGSLEEMTQYTQQITKKTVKGKDQYFFEGEPMDLHRDTCDKIVFVKSGKEFRRIPEVLDVWMDSGSVPFAEYHYPFENKEIYERSKPADFIVEYVGQVRAWFSMLLRVSTMVFGEVPFLNAVCYGIIAGTDGRKMSKSFGNYPDPKIVLEKYGGDAMRLYFMASTIMKGADININEEEIAENYKFLLILWNSYKYFVDYAVTFNWDCRIEEAGGKSSLTTLDKWILAKLTSLVLDVGKSLDSYNIPKATTLLKDFLVNDFSTWYIRRSRDRISSNEDSKDRNTGLAVMYGVLVTFTKLAAPVIPFITEEMYKNLTGDESVHLTDYPKGDKSLLDDKLIEDMNTLRKLVEMGHAQRKKANMKLRQPLSSVEYTADIRLSEELEKILAEELNVKKVEYKKGRELGAKVDIRLTPELLAEGEARDLIRQIQQMRKEMGLTLKDKIVIKLNSLPKSEALVSLVLKQTNAISLSKGDKLEIILVNE